MLKSGPELRVRELAPNGLNFGGLIIRIGFWVYYTVNYKNLL